MKILFTSYPFYPHIAGIETVSMLLAHEFVRRGHEVKLVTATPNTAPDDFPFEVVRRPGPLSLLHCVPPKRSFRQTRLTQAIEMAIQ